MIPLPDDSLRSCLDLQPGTGGVDSGDAPKAQRQRTGW